MRDFYIVAKDSNKETGEVNNLYVLCNHCNSTEYYWCNQNCIELGTVAWMDKEEAIKVSQKVMEEILARYKNKSKEMKIEHEDYPLLCGINGEIVIGNWEIEIKKVEFLN